MMNVALSRFMVVSLLHLARHSTEKGRTRSLFIFSPHDSAVDEISFISIIFNWQLNSENDVSLLLSAISNDFKIIRRE
jgi:hypothetical protein